MYSSDYLDVRESDDRERAAVNVVIRHHERASRHRMPRCVFEASKGGMACRCSLNVWDTRDGLIADKRVMAYF